MRNLNVEASVKSAPFLSLEKIEKKDLFSVFSKNILLNFQSLSVLLQKKLTSSFTTSCEKMPFDLESFLTIVGHEADFLINGTSLEGSTMLIQGKHIESFIKKRAEQGGISSETLDKLKTFFSSFEYLPQNQEEQVRKALAQNIADKILALAPGEYLSMEGGWTDKNGGHAMIYKFVRRKDNLYDIYLYNTGEGVSFHPRLWVNDGVKKKIMYSPYVKFQGVEPERLGFLDKKAYPEFFDKLIDLCNGMKKDYFYGAEIIYQNPDGFGLLHDKLAIANPKSSYMSPQRSSTCCFSVFLAAMKSFFATEEEYKRFKFDLKYTDFCFLFEKTESQLQSNLVAKELLEKQGQKLLRSLEKKLDLFSEKQVIEMELKIRSVLDHIASLPKIEVKIPDVVIPLLGKSSQTLILNLQSSPICKDKFYDFLTIYKCPELLYQKITPENLYEYIKKIGSDYHLILYLIEHLASSLMGFTENDYLKISKKEAWKIIVELRAISILYQETISNSQNHLKDSSEYINTLWSLFFGTISLGKVLFPSLLKYPIAYNQLTRPDRYTSFFSKKEQENMVRNITCFESQGEGEKIFDFPRVNQICKNEKYPLDIDFLWGVAKQEGKNIDYPSVKEAAELFTAPFERKRHVYASFLRKRDVYASFLSESIRKSFFTFQSQEGQLVKLLQEMSYLVGVASGNNELSSTYGYDPVYRLSERDSTAEIFYEDSFLFNKTSSNDDLWKKKRPFHDVSPLVDFAEKNENGNLLKKEGFKLSSESPTCVKALQCSKLLYHFSDNIVKLAEKNEQQQFFRFLFQADTKDLKKDPPLFKALLDKAFVKQLSSFIDQGILFFSSPVYLKRADVINCLFFVRLGRRVKQIDPKALVHDFSDLINEWLTIKDLKAEEINILHLHRVLQYKWKDLKDLKEKELEEIFTSWIRCCDSSFDDKGDGRNQKVEAHRFLFSLISSMESISSTCLDKVLYNITGKSEKGDWTCQKFPVYEKGIWRINLLSGQVEENSNLIKKNIGKDIASCSIYRKIFNNEVFPVEIINNTYAFLDDKTGYAFRFISGYRTDLIQMNYKDEWYEFWNEGALHTEPLNNLCFVKENYHHFFNENGHVFLDKVTRRIAFEWTKEKGLIDVIENAEVIFENFPELNLFEVENWRIHEKKRGDGLRIIRFPRFATSSGNELRLIEKETRKLVLEENQNFVLIKPIEGILDLLRNKLFFQSEKTKEIKILVPIKPSFEEMTLAPKQFINTSSPGVTTRASSYAEYSYKKGKIIPKDRQSKAFLGYLYFIQKNELGSLACLEGLGRDRKINPEIRNILYFIFRSKSNQTPSGGAISLRAAIFLMKENRFAGEDRDLLMKLVENYQNSYNNVPEELRLSFRELSELQLLERSIYFTKTNSIYPFSSFYEEKELKLSLIPSYGSTFNDKEEFYLWYDLLREAKTSEEKACLLARCPIRSFKSETDKAILLLAGQHIGALPPCDRKIYKKFHEFLGEFSKALSDKIDVYLIPPCKKAVDTDVCLPTGISLRKLPKTYLEPVTFSEESSFEYTNPPLVDLEMLFVIPYFMRSLPYKSAQIASLKVPNGLHSIYKRAVERGIKEVNAEIELGQKERQREISFKLKYGISLEKVKKELSLTLSEIESFLVKQRMSILSLGNLLPKDPDVASKIIRLQEGKYKSKVEFESLVTHYLKGSYKDLNPFLTENQFKDLDFKIQQYLTLATTAQQIEKALEQDEPHLMAQMLDQKIAYDPKIAKEERVFLVYEYRSNLRIKQDQVKAIRAMLKNEDAVLQMIMGGGKTTVLTSILLEMIQPGKIALFIPPSGQFETQVANLSEMQKEYFYKEIIPMSFSREDFSIEKLKWIERKLKESALYQEPIVTTSLTLEALQLEWLSLLDENLGKEGAWKVFFSSWLLFLEEKFPTCYYFISKVIEYLDCFFKKFINYKNNYENSCKDKIDSLTNILKLLKNDGIALIDEVDQILDLFKELNFPIGEKEPLTSEAIDLIEKIFQLHLDPDIETILGLTKGMQSSLSTNEYKDKIIPKIAEGLFDSSKDTFKLESSLKNSWIQYVIQGKEDHDLRKVLEDKMKSSDLEIVKSAQMTFLAKGLFFHILPHVMSKTENKNYGIPKGSQTRKVVPFLGVDSPANTEFAGPYETASYHYLTALSSPITAPQLMGIAKKLLERALPILQYTKTSLNETLEAKEFFSLTGCLLGDFRKENPEEMEKALEHLRKNPEKRLKLEKIFISEKVGVYRSYYRSNPQSFCNLFSLRKGLTGTPYNRLTYPESLRKNVHLEAGTEGKIRSAFLERADRGESLIHVNRSDLISEVLSSALQGNPRGKSFRALLDPAGRFKDLSNEKIAQEILTYFENDSNITTVLFFGRVEGNMGVPGTLMMLRKPRQKDGTFSVEAIEGTQKECLEAKGIDPSSTITYYDQKHCEATDIPQIPGALGLVTVNHHLLDRDFLQTNLRLRGYLKNQDIDLLIQENELKNYGRDVTGRQILSQMEVTQEIQNADDGFTSYIQKLEEIVRNKAIGILLDSPTSYNMYKVRNTLVVEQDLSPYALFGRVSKQITPLEAFHLHKKKIPSTPIYVDEPFLQDIASLETNFKNQLLCFPALVSTFDGFNSKEVEMEVSVKQEVKVEAASEIELEYQSYEQNHPGREFEEISWSEKNIKIVEGDRSDNKPKIEKLYHLFQDFKQYKKPYYKIFLDSDLFVSENFSRTSEKSISIFSNKQKLAEQILITEKNGEFKALLLSAKEGAFFKQLIEKGLTDTWLYLPDGHLHVTSIFGTLPNNKKKLQKALFDVNLLSGNCGYLFRHTEELKQRILAKPELKELLLRYLSVHAIGNSKEKGALERLIVALA